MHARARYTRTRGIIKIDGVGEKKIHYYYTLRNIDLNHRRTRVRAINVYGCDIPADSFFFKFHFYGCVYAHTGVENLITPPRRRDRRWSYVTTAASCVRDTLLPNACKHHTSVYDFRTAHVIRFLFRNKNGRPNRPISNRLAQYITARYVLTPRSLYIYI